MNLLALVLALTAPKVDLDVVYDTVGNTKLQIDIYHPVGVPSDKLAPAVLVIHGGAWMSGKRQDMAAICQAIAAEGMLAATTQYRLAPKDKWPTMLDDCQTAMRYLRENAAKLQIDPARVGSCGASAGGHLALLLGFRDTSDKMRAYQTQSSRANAVFNIFGPTDMSNKTDFPQAVDMLYATVLGKPRDKAEAEIRDASPINFVDKSSPPVFILQGMNDMLVPANQSKMLESKLKSLDRVVEAVYVPGMGHGIDQSNKEVMKALGQGIAFLKKHLAAASR